MESCFPITKVTAHLKVADMTKAIDLSIGDGLLLNYSRGDGSPALKSWISEHLRLLHTVPSDTDSCVTVGSTDAFAKVLSLLDGDSVLFDKYAYGTAVAACTAAGRTAIGVEMDAMGMIPDDLRAKIRIARSKGLNPDIVYLVPTAHNPTSITMPEERKKALYSVCCDEDIIIVEDG